MSDVRFSLQLQGDDVDLATYQATARELRALLDDIGKQLATTGARIVWRLDDDATIRAVASPNGAPAELLHAVARYAREAFESIRNAEGGNVQWPDAVGPRAKRAVRSIVQQLDKVPAITIEADEQSPLIIEHVALRLDIGRPGFPPEHTSVDGVIDLISVRGHVQFSIQEHGSNRRIRCAISEDWLPRAKDALGKRVVVEGLVRFNKEGVPISISGITSLWQRPDEKRPLSAIIGALPDFTGGLPAGEYVRRLRNGGNGGD
jgi:hypothetical protein